MKITLLFIAFTIANAHIKHYNTLQSNGIVFDKISSALKIERYWNIHYYYDLQSLSTDISNLKTYVNELNTICKKSKIICRSITALLNEKLDLLSSEELFDR